MNEQQYIKGFNNGYTLSKYKPDLINKLMQNLHPSNDYLEGLFSGREEFELETSRDQLQELHRLRNESRDRDHNLERE